MKRNIYTRAFTHSRIHAFILAALFLLASCGKEEGGSVVAEPDPMFGTIADPAWVVDTNYDYSTSMTAVVGVDLQGGDSLWAITAADRLAAFVGDECVGLAAPTGELFFLFIVPGSNPYQPVALRYYSAYYRNVFRSEEAFPFVNGDQQGTASAPLHVTFKPTTVD